LAGDARLGGNYVGELRILKQKGCKILGIIRTSVGADQIGLEE
jgi:hypothetical protein